MADLPVTLGCWPGGVCPLLRPARRRTAPPGKGEPDLPVTPGGPRPAKHAAPGLPTAPMARFAWQMAPGGVRDGMRRGLFTH